MEEIILIGGGGHCRACIDVIEQEAKYKIVGIIDMPELLGEKILGYPIIGNDDDLPELVNRYDNFFITIGQIKGSKNRIKIFNLLKNLEAHLPLIISPLAYVSKHTVFGEGTIVMHHAIVNANAVVGLNCIINTKALIEHDVFIGSHCHISTGSIVNGQTEIQDSCFIGSNTVIANNIEICANTTIGSGANVVKNITEQGIYLGNPAKYKV